MDWDRYRQLQLRKVEKTPVAALLTPWLQAMGMTQLEQWGWAESGPLSSKFPPLRDCLSSQVPAANFWGEVCMLNLSKYSILPRDDGAGRGMDKH